MRGKRFIAGLCTTALCCGVVSCTPLSDDESDLENTPSAIELEEADISALNDIANEKLTTDQLDDTYITFLSNWDLNPGDGQIMTPDLQMFKDKYNGSIKYIPTTWDNRYVDLTKLVLTGDPPDFFSAMDMDAFPKGAIKNMFEPIDPYIDLRSDLWYSAKPLCDAFMFDGGHYVAGIQSYPQYVCVYNKKTIEENGFEDPAELYWKNEWTWSKFSQMCKDFTDAKQGKYALDGWWYPQALNDTCGTPLISLEHGKLVNNMSAPQVKTVQGLMYALQKDGVCYSRAENGDTIRGGEVIGTGVATGETLFYPVGLWAIEDSPENVAPFGDVEKGEIMFVPMPRLDDSDKYYVTARVDGYLLCKNAPNPQGFAAYMNCRMATLTDAKEISLKQLREKYKWNDDMIRMRDEVVRLVNDHPIYDFQDGINDEMKDVMEKNVRGITMSTYGNYAPWDKVLREQKDNIDTMINEANESIHSKRNAALNGTASQ